MNILKFEKKNIVHSIENKNLKYSSFDLKKFEKHFVFFSKKELSSILNLYSKQVAKGFWKDYALDSQIENVIFSVYKHSHDKPVYQIIKKRLKGFKNKPIFYIKKDEEIISKSSDLYVILLKFERKLSIKKLKNN